MVYKIQEEFSNLLEDNTSKMKKNRNEVYKQIKGLDIEIKSLWTELKKKKALIIGY